MLITTLCFTVSDARICDTTEWNIQYGFIVAVITGVSTDATGNFQTTLFLYITLQHHRSYQSSECIPEMAIKEDFSSYGAIPPESSWWFLCKYLQITSVFSALVWLNTLRPRHDGCHVTDDIFKYISLNGNNCVLLKFYLEIVPKGPMNNKTALFQMMVRGWTCDNPLSKPIKAKWRTYASLDLDELTI